MSIHIQVCLRQDTGCYPTSRFTIPCSMQPTRRAHGSATSSILQQSCAPSSQIPCHTAHTMQATLPCVLPGTSVCTAMQHAAVPAHVAVPACGPLAPPTSPSCGRMSQQHALNMPEVSQHARLPAFIAPTCMPFVHTIPWCSRSQASTWPCMPCFQHLLLLARASSTHALHAQGFAHT